MFLCLKQVYCCLTSVCVYKSQMGQDQVSGRVSILCWLAAPVVMFYGNLQNLAIRSKSVIKSSSVISSQIGVMSDRGLFLY